MAQSKYGVDVNVLASPIIGEDCSLAESINSLSWRLWKARNLPKDWAAFAWEHLQQIGQSLLRDGKAVNSEEDNLAELNRLAEEFKSKGLKLARDSLGSSDHNPSGSGQVLAVAVSLYGLTNLGIQPKETSSFSPAPVSVSVVAYDTPVSELKDCLISILESVAFYPSRNSPRRAHFNYDSINGGPHLECNQFESCSEAIFFGRRYHAEYYFWAWQYRIR